MITLYLSSKSKLSLGVFHSDAGWASFALGKTFIPYQKPSFSCPNQIIIYLHFCWSRLKCDQIKFPFLETIFATLIRKKIFFY